MVRSVVCYGAETWTVTRQDEKVVNLKINDNEINKLNEWVPQRRAASRRGEFVSKTENDEVEETCRLKTTT